MDNKKPAEASSQEHLQDKHIISEIRYRRLFESAKDGILILDAQSGKIEDVNPFLIDLLGYSRNEFLNKTVWDIGLFKDIIPNKENFLQLKEKKYIRYENLPLQTANGQQISVEFVSNVYQEDHRDVIQCNIRDITDRKRAETYREAGREILQILNEPGDLKKAIHRVLEALKTRTGSDAVGLRLQEGDDFPYFVQDGFSKDFLLTENTLVERDKDGGVCRDMDGNVRLECTCGLVISGHTDPTNPLFTKGGSCWTNESFPLLDLPSAEDPRLHPRNNCIHQGYASVALIPLRIQDRMHSRGECIHSGFNSITQVPIRTTDRIVGLIQLNDKRKGHFSLEVIEILEDIAAHVGSALMRKQAEEALQRSKNLLAETEHIGKVGGWSFNIDTMKRTWTDEVYRIHEVDISPYPSVEAGINFYTAESRPIIEKAVQRAIEFGEDYDLDLEIITAKGNTRAVHAIGKADLKNRRIYGFFQDITERKRAEEAMRQTKAILQTAMDCSPSGIAIADAPNGKLRYVNDAGLLIRGGDRESVVKGVSVEQYVASWKLLDFDGRPLKNDEVPLARAIMFGETNSREFIIRRKEGEDRVVIANAAPIKDENGKIASAIVVFSDITERKQAEEAIAAEKERLSVTLRSIGDGVITTDTLSNVVVMNKVAEELTGWKLNEAQGKPLSAVFNIINQNTRKPHENPVEKVLSTGTIIELANHTLLISRDGTERIIADSGAPIKDKESKTIGVVLVFRDMTEKHKLLDHMQRIDKLDSLGVLAGGIAHDFNNLLGGIFGYIDMARERTTTDKTVLKYLDKALGVFERAKDLTQQLLTFSKGGAPKRKTGQIGNLVRENAAFVLSGTNVSCDYQIAQDLWLADYDANQIGQVIDNIVLNAQQAMPVGGTIVISVNNLSLESNENPALKAGHYVRVSITDTGVGIPQELLKRIFDPFFTTKQKGNGLGLATCYSIVQKHDGCIDVESVPGKGSTFHIYLPATHKGIVQDVSRIAAQHRGKGSILVMDDEKFMREIVGDMLSTMGYDLLEAENGEEALQLCAKAKKQGNPIDAALFDLTIPNGMGGKETIVTFREQFPETPVFASSGFSEDPSMARPTEFGFTDSIRKPFRIGELAEMLNKHLGMQK